MCMVREVSVDEWVCGGIIMNTRTVSFFAVVAHKSGGGGEELGWRWGGGGEVALRPCAVNRNNFFLYLERLQ